MKNLGRTFIIVGENDVQSEEDIYVIKANNIDDALKQYAKEKHLNNSYLKETMEDRSINMTFWEPFFAPIYNWGELVVVTDSDGNLLTDLSEEEIEIKLKENIEDYCGENKKFASELIDFYFDESKTFEDLSKELIEYIVLKETLKDREFIIVKEL